MSSSICEIYDRFFQFTTSQGGRPYTGGMKLGRGVFQFTTSQGGRPLAANPDAQDSLFQFTTSQGGRPGLTELLQADVGFQFTTSQGGRLLWRYRSNGTGYLSIHDLTRRSTSLFFLCSHIFLSFNSRPHKEVDFPSINSFVRHSIFQFTTSQGGRPNKALDYIQDNAFQFTTSQGGRLRGIRQENL